MPQSDTHILPRAWSLFVVAMLVLCGVLHAAPRIIVEGPDGTALADNAPISFGETPAQRPSTRTFTIRNDGDVALQNVNAFASGDPWSRFVVDQKPASVIPPGGSSTFTVTFHPLGIPAQADTSPTLRSAKLGISCNDPARGLTYFPISGLGFDTRWASFQQVGAPWITLESVDLTGLGLGGSIWDNSLTGVDLVVFNNTGTAPVTGIFDGLPEGSFVPLNSVYGQLPTAHRITYTGGDGNDVVLMPSAAPGIRLPYSVESMTGETAGTKGLNFYVNSGPLPVTVHVDYGLDASYGSTVQGSVANGANIGDASCRITGLQLGKTYHFRLRAINSAGTTMSRDMTFDTSGSPSFHFESPEDIGVTQPAIQADLISPWSFSLGFPPTPGQVLTLVNVTGTEPVTGIFPNRPAGSFVRAWNGNTPYYFTIRYDGGDGNDITLTLGAPPPQIALDGLEGILSTIDLGAAPLGRTLTRTFVLRNTGGLDLTDIHVTCTGVPRFTVTSPPTTLPPGGSGSFTVSYLPQAPVSGVTSNARITVTSNDPFLPALEFFTSAQGIDLGTVHFTTDAGQALVISNQSLDANGITLPPMTMSFAPQNHTRLRLIDIMWTYQITGIFNGLPEGEIVQVMHNGTPYSFMITYKGGDGNDVVLIRTPPPYLNPPAAYPTAAAVSFQADVALNHRPRVALFYDYGLDDSYGSSVNARYWHPNPNQPVGYASGGVTGLLPGVTYHYRLRAVDTDVTVLSPDATFTTSGELPATFTAPDHVPYTFPVGVTFRPDLFWPGPMAVTFSPAIGQVLTLIRLPGTAPNGSRMPGAAQDGIVTVLHGTTPYTFRLRYDGGDGNDITLTRIATQTDPAVKYITGNAGASFSSNFTLTGATGEPEILNCPYWLTASYNPSNKRLTFTSTSAEKDYRRILVHAPGATVSRIVIVVTVSESWDQWRVRHFSSAERSIPSISGTMGDASGGGVKNLLKYALNVPAQSSAGETFPVPAIQALNGQSYLTLTYSRDTLVKDLTYTVEVCDALGTWRSGSSYVLETSRLLNSDGTETVTTRDLTPVGDGKKRFMRLKVTD